MIQSRISSRTILSLVFVFLSSACAFAQAPTAPAPDSSETNINGIIKDTQKQIDGQSLAGMVWWVPTEFWEQSAVKRGSSLQKARETFSSLRQYTVVIVLAGKVGLGNINWYSENEIRSSTSLRDSDGQIYKPITDISPDAAGLLSIIKPVMANVLGPAGQNLQVLFFASKTAKGAPIADPTAEGSFAVLIDGLGGEKLTSYEWRLPLTSLTPPRYCPIGKERMEASWKYCPWHGVKLPPVVLHLLDLPPNVDKPQ